MKLPTQVWSILKDELSRDTKGRKQRQITKWKEIGGIIQIRLKSGRTVFITVDGEGVVTGEAADIGHDYWISPSFIIDDIESWGYKEWVWVPTWLNPFKKISCWKVVAWADENLLLSHEGRKAHKVGRQ
ncbi:hypothetical protein [Undibacterium terreum]|uniref:Uncharacterized protein n=1 Tax=Undibacterium terreum TaxID=1224302 RepID=A0A916XEJ6_9BURK|nr:hypothetical protein [Undibacterium terreum]GGC66039.1 hypothetical protein GCM10011396_11270 [Undibacterium terreum]